MTQPRSARGRSAVARERRTDHTDVSLETARAELERAGRRLAEVLALAEALPHRPSAELRCPRLPT